MENQELSQFDNIERRIIMIRNRQVMIDKDLAELYGVELRALNQSVKRNIKRFPARFMFQLTKEEQDRYNYLMSLNNPNLKSQFVISSSDSHENKNNKSTNWGGKRTFSYAFTQQGVAMLSAVLHSDTAVDVSVKIMDAFVVMQQFISNNANMFAEIDAVKKHLLESDLHHLENDKKIEQLFVLMDKHKDNPAQGVFCAGQIFDAYVFVSDLIKRAKNEIILIDNYIDETVFTMLDKRNDCVKATIYTAKLSTKMQLDLQKHNSQYFPINIEHSNKSHDRFLIIDEEVYHIGASLKDLGKRVFAFSKMEIGKDIILSIL